MKIHPYDLVRSEPSLAVGMKTGEVHGLVTLVFEDYERPDTNLMVPLPVGTARLLASQMLASCDRTEDLQREERARRKVS